MGGYGSTRWGWHRKAITVEDCRELSVWRLTQEGVIAQGLWYRGSWVWLDSQTGEKRASIGYLADVRETTGKLELTYDIPTRPELGLLEYPVRLASTSPYFGGLRWWFICPLAGCGRRVGKLYLPAGGKYFGCRHCYKLTYRSSQNSDKRVSALVRLLASNPEAALARLEGAMTAADSILLLKAHEKIGLWKRW